MLGFHRSRAGAGRALRTPFTALSSSNGCIGILRETKNKWERRVPLVPKHVAKLVENGIKVIVQPSTRRVFHDKEFEQAGAEISDDLTKANVIFGVKEFPSSQLIPNKSYVMFSHVIKAQPYNMPFLDVCLTKNVKLFDYEKIMSVPKPESGEKAQRLVAFGKYAGIAGMIDCLRGVGERLLSMGYSTPFLGISSAFMYPTVDAAKKAVAAAGEEIRKYGLPANLGDPFTFVFTGSGRVAEGALEIFKLLPHEMISPEELLRRKKAGLISNSDNKVYGIIVTAESLVESISGKPFSKSEYYSQPELYKPIFHENLAPLTNVLVNCVYWDYRFPRILTKKQLKQLSRSSAPNRLIEIADISADLSGSIEFTQKHTSIDDPFYLYDGETDTFHQDMEGRGVLMMTIENLPAEFPRDASIHFSEALYPFASKLASIDPSRPLSEQETELPKELIDSCIVADKELRPAFKYIQKLRIQNERESASQSNGSEMRHKKVVRIDGHLFDSGLINQVLDAVELSGSNFSLLHLSVSPNQELALRTSRVVIQIMSPSENVLGKVVEHIQTLCRVVSRAEATFSSLPYGAILTSVGEVDAKSAKINLSSSLSPKVLVLGSGMVARPLLMYLDEHKIPSLVASNDFVRAEKLSKDCVNGYVSPNGVDVSNSQAVAKLIGDPEIKVVISLLPAPWHIEIAKHCLEYSKHLVTSSYVSKEMQELNSVAASKGLTFLNEMGLDPGIDHMSASRIIHSLQNVNAHVKSFESYCGGLPAPEVASENPFRYKFSWSPRGVFSAMQQSASFIRNSQVINVPGVELLSNACDFPALPLLQLEHLPNRNSLPYCRQYSLDEGKLSSMYRATLRYKSFSSLMSSFRSMGFLSSTPIPSNLTSWKDCLTSIHQCDSKILKSKLLAALPSNKHEEALEALRFLGILDEEIPIEGTTLLDAFCALLQKVLKYEEGERDMVVMYHKFGVGTGQNIEEYHCSSLVCYGDPIGDTAMARTVGIPSGIGARLILEKQVNATGVITPVIPSIFEPALEELRDNGIIFHDKIVKA